MQVTLLSTQTISAPDSTIQCLSERHLISMTTRKDIIPFFPSVNWNVIQLHFAIWRRHTMWAACWSLTYQQVRRTVLDGADTDDHNRVSILRIKVALYQYEETHSGEISSLWVRQSNKWYALYRRVLHSHSFTDYSLVCCKGSVFTCGNNLASSIPFSSRIITKSRNNKDKYVEKKYS